MIVWRRRRKRRDAAFAARLLLPPGKLLRRRVVGRGRGPSLGPGGLGVAQPSAWTGRAHG